MGGGGGGGGSPGELSQVLPLSKNRGRCVAESALIWLSGLTKSSARGVRSTLQIPMDSQILHSGSPGNKNTIPHK